jgi:hypothetical protein
MPSCPSSESLRSRFNKVDLGLDILIPAIKMLQKWKDSDGAYPGRFQKFPRGTAQFLEKIATVKNLQYPEGT